MKAAATAFLSCDSIHSMSLEKAAEAAETSIASAEAAGIELLVFPALTGLAFASRDGGEKENNFFSTVRKISEKHPHIAVCPGSMWLREMDKTYPYSCLMRNGEVLLEQRQLYLSAYERTMDLSRGETLEFVMLSGFKTCIILATDAFYPQVSRFAALHGAQLVICPMAIEKQYGPAFQLAGVWREVQQNQFFAVESCLRGTLLGKEYDGEPAVHATLASTPGDDGFLAKGGDIAIAELDEGLRQRGISDFDVLSRLNPELYRRMGMLGGGKK